MSEEKAKYETDLEQRVLSLEENNSTLIGEIHELKVQVAKIEKEKVSLENYVSRATRVDVDVIKLVDEVEKLKKAGL